MAASFFYLVTVLCLLVSLPSVSTADSTIEVKGLRHWSTPEYTRVVIDISGAVEFSKGKLSNPDRLFFDLKNTTIAKECQRTFAVNDKLIKTIRLGQFNANTARIVFDMAASDYDFKAFSLEDPPRFVIDIVAKVPPADKKADPKAPDVQSTEPVKKPDTKKPDVRTEAGLMQRKIVIDAGHGGHDSGAVGPTGLYEKDVVLDVALKVRDIIRRDYPGCRVILTRDSDVFIPLPRRAQIANENDADFFLSIHANASPNRQARGIETYFLNWTDDEEALRVAARENAISIKEMKKMQSEMDVILASLDRDRKRDDSLKLAGYVQKSLVATMKPHYPKLHDLGVKSALFYVLVGAKMSSALAEVSFISNPEEERLLSTDDYRRELAESLVSGIDSYFASVPQQRMVSHTPGEKIGYNRDAPGDGAYKARSAKYIRRTR